MVVVEHDHRLVGLGAGVEQQVVPTRGFKGGFKVFTGSAMGVQGYQVVLDPGARRKRADVL